MPRKKIRRKKIIFENLLASESKAGTRRLFFSLHGVGEILLYTLFNIIPECSQGLTRHTESFLVMESHVMAQLGALTFASIFFSTVKVKYAPPGMFKVHKATAEAKPLSAFTGSNSQGLSKVEMKDSFSACILLYPSCVRARNFVLNKDIVFWMEHLQIRSRLDKGKDGWMAASLTQGAKRKRGQSL